jgi:NAD-dependent SIR2 family protein deacetylase
MAERVLEEAAAAIGGADALVICAGAGMGVDSGLPDFRGDEGFWEAYPPLAARGLSFMEVANPQWFAREPDTAWGFYGHRLQLYRETTPHAGFAILLGWARQKEGGARVFTSNVDGQFQKAGFAQEHLLECHGSIHYLQCSVPCNEEIWPAEDVWLEIDESTFLAQPPLPACPHCGEAARPNILMFGDGKWIWNRTRRQEAEYENWLNGLGGRNLTVVECGAGSAVPTVRRQSEMLQQWGAQLVRINLKEAEGPNGTISVAQSALTALQQIEGILARV